MAKPTISKLNARKNLHAVPREEESKKEEKEAGMTEKQIANKIDEIAGSYANVLEKVILGFDKLRVEGPVSLSDLFVEVFPDVPVVTSEESLTSKKTQEKRAREHSEMIARKNPQRNGEGDDEYNDRIASLVAESLQLTEQELEEQKLYRERLKTYNLRYAALELAARELKRAGVFADRKGKGEGMNRAGMVYAWDPILTEGGEKKAAQNGAKWNGHIEEEKEFLARVRPLVEKYGSKGPHARGRIGAALAMVGAFDDRDPVQISKLSQALDYLNRP